MIRATKPSIPKANPCQGKTFRRVKLCLIIFLTLGLHPLPALLAWAATRWAFAVVGFLDFSAWLCHGTMHSCIAWRLLRLSNRAG